MNQQAMLTAIVQNLKRLVKYLGQPSQSTPNQGAVRPERISYWRYGLFPLYPALLMLISYASRLLTHSLPGYHEKPAIHIT